MTHPVPPEVEKKTHVWQRADPRTMAARDAERHTHRVHGTRAFLRAISLIGSVGWPIVILSVGGAWLGHHIDERLQDGVRYTLSLLSVGVALGCATAWRAVTRP